MKNEATAPKTIREWLTELNEPWRTEALELIENGQVLHIDEPVPTLYKALHCAFNVNGNQADLIKVNNIYAAYKNKHPSKPTPPDLHALLKEILADEQKISSDEYWHYVVTTAHIKAVFKKYGVEIEQPF